MNRQPPFLSVVIPAHNEERELPACLAAAFAALESCGVAGEVVVADDGSEDRTAEIAEVAGATVVRVNLRNIGAVRNAGAAAATGDRLVFVDADTRLPPDTLAAILDAFEAGAVGGGARLRWDEPPRLSARVCSRVFLFFWQTVFGFATGCLMFARREDFEAVGGFDPDYFAAEERFLTTALKARGRFVIVRPPVVTSARKMRLFSTPHLIGVAVKALFRGRGPLRRRRGLELLYDAPREPAAESA